MIRWTASARLSHDPDSGVYKGITPSQGQIRLGQQHPHFAVHSDRRLRWQRLGDEGSITSWLLDIGAGAPVALRVHLAALSQVGSHPYYRESAFHYNNDFAIILNDNKRAYEPSESTGCL